MEPGQARDRRHRGAGAAWPPRGAGGVATAARLAAVRNSAPPSPLDFGGLSVQNRARRIPFVGRQLRCRVIV